MINKCSLFIFDGHIHGLTGSKIKVFIIPLHLIILVFKGTTMLLLIKIPDQSHIFGISTIAKPLTQEEWP